MVISSSEVLKYQLKTLGGSIIREIENIFNKEVAKVNDWFVDNYWSIYFGEDKTE